MESHRTPRRPHRIAARRGAAGRRGAAARRLAALGAPWLCALWLCGVWLCGAPPTVAAALATAEHGVFSEHGVFPEHAADRSPSWAPPLGFPIDVAAAYRAPPHRYGAGHRGIDLLPNPSAEPGGSIPVAAPASGTVSFAGRVVDRPVVSIRIDDRTLVSLEPVSSVLAVGDAVSRGESIGTLADGGHCDGGCVHLGVRIDGEYANPTPFLIERPILLPLEGP